MIVLLGLATALFWGAADFGGGIAAKRTSSYGVVIVAHIGSGIIMGIAALLMGETVPPIQSWLLGAAAGVAGGTGLMLLYRALAEGKMSIAAPVSAVVGVSITVLFGGFTQGVPALLTLLGFALALASVWLLASEDGIVRASLKDLALPGTAGVMFGLFFILIALAGRQATFWPVASARIGSITSLLAFSTLTRKDWKPARQHWGLLLLVGVIDVTGTVCYATAAQIGRLDVASVLSSFYPGVTVLLAWVFLREKISLIQWVGVLLALGAIILLTL
jgi:drug/metabolite transporter (DMT)-like permease